MTASEGSYVGFAKQAEKGTPITDDTAFKYILFREGSMAPNNLFVPLDQEVGGGALLRSVIKAGVMSAGQFDFIPRPSSLGMFLAGVAGDDTLDDAADPTMVHTFALGVDQFSAPYYTVRVSPGGLWGETFQDCRIAGLGINWKAADYVRGQLAVIGGLPTPNVSMTTWDADTYVDGGPQFIAPVSDIELPTSTDIKVLSGSLAMQMNIPMDEQWIVGSYNPDDFDINSRVYTVTLGIKIVNSTLYNKMAYDPAAGSAWLAAMYKEADFKLFFQSDQNIPLSDPAAPYSLDINGNGSSGSAANVTWQITPVAMRAGRQLIATVTGTFLADSTLPIQCVLTNADGVAY